MDLAGMLWLPCLVISMGITGVNALMNLDNKTKYAGTLSCAAIGFLVLSLVGDYMMAVRWLNRNDMRAIQDVVMGSRFGQFAVYFLLVAVNIYLVARKEIKLKKDE